MIVNPRSRRRRPPSSWRCASASRGKINFGSGSASTRISGELLKAKTGIDMLHVPYKSTPAALQDTMAGHVQMCFADPVTSLPQVKAGTVRCLGRRQPRPLQAHARHPDPDRAGHSRLRADDLDGHSDAARRAAARHGEAARGHARDHHRSVYVERQAQGGSEIAPCTSEEMGRIMVAEIELYREMMKVAGIEPE